MEEDEYYEEIGPYELNKLFHNKAPSSSKITIPFSNKQFDIINKKVIVDPDIRMGAISGLYFTSHKTGTTKKSLKIYQLPDEWFVIINIWDIKHYKCDQMDGLIKCIEDIYE